MTWFYFSTWFFFSRWRPSTVQYVCGAIWSKEPPRDLSNPRKSTFFSLINPRGGVLQSTTPLRGVRGHAPSSRKFVDHCRIYNQSKHVFLCKMAQIVQLAYFRVSICNLLSLDGAVFPALYRQLYFLSRRRRLDQVCHFLFYIYTSRNTRRWLGFKKALICGRRLATSAKGAFRA